MIEGALFGPWIWWTLRAVSVAVLVAIGLAVWYAHRDPPRVDEFGTLSDAWRHEHDRADVREGRDEK